MSIQTTTAPHSSSVDGLHNITELYATCSVPGVTEESIPATGTTVTVQTLLVHIAAICRSVLSGAHSTPSKPSITILSDANEAHKVHIFSPRNGSPALFLTKDMLNCEIVVSATLNRRLCELAVTRRQKTIHENKVTRDILGPLFSLWATIWTDASKVGPGFEWAPSVLEPSEGGGDVDVLITRALKATDITVDVDVAAIEAKTPLACGNKDIVDFGKKYDTTDIALARQCIRHLMRCNKSMKENGVPWPRSPTLGALMVYPNHFFPVAYQDDLNSFVLFQDAIHIDDLWPETKDKLENHMKAVSVAAAWMFMLIVTTDEERKQLWGNVCQKQVDQAVEWMTTAGEQLASPKRIAATLMRHWAALFASIYQLLFSLLLALVSIERFRALVLPNGDVLVGEPSPKDWRIPFTLKMPLPRLFHKSYTAKTFVYASPRVAVKVYDNVEPFARELMFYETWSEALGSAIPKLLGSGRRTSDNKPFLILSNEGQAVTNLTEEDKANIQRTVLDVIHKEGWHHHDLAARNVLRKPSGDLCLIDFGLASKCDRERCDEFWDCG